MKTEVIVTNSDTNPEAFITIKSGWKIIDIFIKPRMYHCDVKTTSCYWVEFVDKNNSRRLNEETQEFLHDIVREHYESDRVTHVLDTDEMFELILNREKISF